MWMSTTLQRALKPTIATSSHDLGKKFIIVSDKNVLIFDRGGYTQIWQPACELQDRCELGKHLVFQEIMIILDPGGDSNLFILEDRNILRGRENFKNEHAVGSGIQRKRKRCENFDTAWMRLYKSHIYDIEFVKTEDCSYCHAHYDFKDNFSISTSRLLVADSISFPAVPVSFLSSARCMCTAEFCASKLQQNSVRTIFYAIFDASSNIAVLDLSEYNISGWLSHFKLKASGHLHLNPGKRILKSLVHK